MPINVLGILQARSSSARLPGKVMRPLCDKPMLQQEIERLQNSKKMDQLVLATSTDPSDNELANYFSTKLPVVRGDLNDVLLRFIQTEQAHPATHIVRLTGDCPLHDASVVDAVIGFHLEQGFDYTSNVSPPTFPDGLDVEVLRTSVLHELNQIAQAPAQREHVTYFLHSETHPWSMGNFRADKDYSHLRFTVDNADDFAFVSQVYDELYAKNPAFSWQDVYNLIQQKPTLLALNQHHKRNEALQ